MLKFIIKILEYLCFTNYGIHVVSSTVRYIKGVIAKKYSINDISKFAFVAFIFNFLTCINLKSLYDSIFKHEKFVKQIDFDLDWFVNDELLTEEDKEYLKNIDNPNCSKSVIMEESNDHFTSLKPINRDFEGISSVKKRIKKDEGKI